MNHTLTESTIALAAIFQAAQLVQEVSRQGRKINRACEASIHSLFMLDADSTDEIYGGIDGVQLGLQTLVDHLGENSKNRRDIELTRYVLALIYLERKLAKNREMLDKISRGITTATGQVEYFSETHVNVISSLADLYQQTISTLLPRIMVKGEPVILNVQENANLIRVLLLAGIRAAVLWRQCGGSRLQFIFKRKAIVNTARELLLTLPDGL